MKKIILFLTFITTLAIHGQSFEWIQTPAITFNSSANLIGYPTTTDALGNVYITGFLNNAYNYSDIYGDLFYNKYDVSGQLLFSKTFTGKGQVYNIQSDSAGNTYLAIAYVQSITIDNTTISTTDQGVKPELLKFDANGSLLWHLSITSFNSTINHFKSIAIDTSDAVYICYDNYNYSYVKKLDPNGNVLLTIEQQNVNLISSVSVDNEGYIYTAGGCANSNSKYANVAVPATYTYNTYVAKYAPTGVFQWVKYVQDITCSEPQVKAKSQDEVYFSSTLYGAYTFGAIVAEGPINNGYDFFLTKLNAAGVFQWVREVPSAGKAFIGKRNFLHIDTTGNVYFTGSTSGTVNWSNTISTTSSIYQDGLVLKYSPDGTILLAKTAGGADTDRFDGVTTNSLGAIFLSGLIRGTSTFDAIQHVETNQYLFYPVLAKINTSNLTNANFNTNNAIVYPIPSNDCIYFQNIANFSKGEIYSVLGQKVGDFQINSAPISIKELAAGTYFVKIDGYNVLKFIKN